MPITSSSHTSEGKETSEKKRNYSIWNTQNSNNSCEYKCLLSDGLSLLMSKPSFNFNKYLLDSLPRNLKSSCTTLWSQTSMLSLTELDKVPLTGLPVLGGTPWCSKTHRRDGVNLKLESVSSESLFNKNKHWICQINLVFIHPTNNSSWFCRDNIPLFNMPSPWLIIIMIITIIIIKHGWNKNNHVSIQHINLYELSEVTASIIKYTS